jgi:CheY-like chemotaxis protein
MRSSDVDKKCRVLVADDEKVIADTLKLILTQAGYDVAAVYDGASAVEMAKQWAPDLFLSDIFMPGLNGIDAAVEICRLLPECKVLLFSGQADLHDLRGEIHSKCNGVEVFSKPIHPTQLIARVRELE